MQHCFRENSRSNRIIARMSLRKVTTKRSGYTVGNKAVLKRKHQCSSTTVETFTGMKLFAFHFLH
jgi:hypothetical protein